MVNKNDFVILALGLFVLATALFIGDKAGVGGTGFVTLITDGSVQRGDDLGVIDIDDLEIEEGSEDSETQEAQYNDVETPFAIDAWGSTGWGSCSDSSGGVTKAEAFCECMGYDGLYDSDTSCYKESKSTRYTWSINESSSACAVKGTQKGGGYETTFIRCGPQKVGGTSTEPDLVPVRIAYDSLTASQGEYTTQTYVMDGTEYEVEVIVISDDTSSAKLKVNGENTDDLLAGEVYTFADGTTIFIEEVLPNEGSEAAGADQVTFILYDDELKYYFKNAGEADITSKFSVSLTDDLTDFSLSGIVNGLEAGETMYLYKNASEVFQKPGLHSLTAKIDGGDYVDESDETNNEVEFEIPLNTVTQGEYTEELQRFSGVSYYVEIIIVSDTELSAKFQIDGETTDSLTAGQSYTFSSDGSILTVFDVDPDEGSEATGADKVTYMIEPPTSLSRGVQATNLNTTQNETTTDNTTQTTNGNTTQTTTDNTTQTTTDNTTQTEIVEDNNNQNTDEKLDEETSVVEQVERENRGVVELVAEWFKNVFGW